MINRRLPFIAIAAVALGGCSQGGGGYVPEKPPEVKNMTVTPGNEAELWPLSVGNEWVYEVQSTQNGGSATRELTFKVTASRKEGDATIATLEILEGSKHLDSSDWRVDKSGIYQINSTDRRAAYTPPQMLCKFPVKDGETFNQDLKGPAPTTGADVVDQKVQNKCRGTERIDTEEGPMEAVTVESNTKFSYKGQDFVTSATLWFVPKVGLARFVQQTSTKDFNGKEIFRLKSHTAK
ncbi:MAG: hypothetical protein KF857_09240 [Fimbriimonadaceae bacterium]|nr:hypothetical protein [Fimbriimonadaceae bacterium]